MINYDVKSAREAKLAFSGGEYFWHDGRLVSILDFSVGEVVTLEYTGGKCTYKIPKRFCYRIWRYRATRNAWLPPDETKLKRLFERGASPEKGRELAYQEWRLACNMRIGPRASELGINWRLGYELKLTPSEMAKKIARGHENFRTIF